MSDDPSKSNLDTIRLRLAVRHDLNDLCRLLTKKGRDRIGAELALGPDKVCILALQEWLASQVDGGNTSDEIIAVLERNGVESATAALVVKGAFDQHYPVSRLKALVKTNYQD
jgi:hypothetical protein